MPAFGQSKDDPGHAPYPAFKIAEGLYYVGSADYAAYLLTTRAGLIAIDGGDAETGKQIIANIRALGFDPGQVKMIVNTHQHFDHAAGLAAIKRAAPRAKLYVSKVDGDVIAAGGRGDPFLKGERFWYEAVKPDVTIVDGQKVSLGGVTLTAHITGGHTRGCTTWTFPVTVAGKPHLAQVHCSSSVLPGYRLVAPETYPGQAADYAKSFATWKTIPCDLFLASHASFYGLDAKRKALEAGKADAFVDPEGCKAFYARQEAAFRKELSKQQAVAR
ncbi:MAG: subclass B3 metallo-beta-lactamase [Phenylobacterium sp.]